MITLYTGDVFICIRCDMFIRSNLLGVCRICTIYMKADSTFQCVLCDLFCELPFLHLCEMSMFQNQNRFIQDKNGDNYISICRRRSRSCKLKWALLCKTRIINADNNDNM